MRITVSALAFLALTTVSAVAEDLSLLCSGSGTYPQVSTANVYSGGNTATGTTTRTMSLNSDIRFELRGDSARILMPPAMTPPMNNGSDSGWWTLDRLEVSTNAISGRFTLNVLNKPRIQIDRMAGTIEVDGNFRYYFLGQCERVETPTAPRF